VIDQNKNLKNKNQSNIIKFFSLAILSFIELCLFIRYSYVNFFELASFEGMLYGSANRPFVTRVFTPWLTRLIDSLIPNQLHSIIAAWIRESPVVSEVIHTYGVSLDYSVEALISILLIYLSLIGFFYFYIKITQKLLQTTTKILAFFVFVAFLGLFPLFKVGYIYDLPQLFLSTLALYLIASNKVLPYFLVFFCAVLNKETSIILIFPSFLLFWNPVKTKVKNVVIGLFSQLTIFSLVRLPLLVKYRDNPGENISFHFFDHLKVIRHYPFATILTLSIAALFILLMIHDWKKKPAIISLGLCSALVLLILFFIGGFPFEFRVFYEVYTILMISVTMSFLALRGILIRIKAQNTEQLIESFGLFWRYLHK